MLEWAVFLRALKTVSSSIWGLLAAFWGVAGFVLLLLFSIFRLTPIALAAFDHALLWYHWLVLVLNIIFMAYTEGYRGFQKGYSPRLLTRARDLAYRPRLTSGLLAPLYCMNYFAAERQRVITAWCVLLMIVVLVLIFHQIPQPWRGLLNIGVIVGLSWGVVATVFCALFDANYRAKYPLTTKR